VTRAFFDPTLGASALATATQEDLAHEQRTRSNTYSATGFVRQEVPTGGTITASTDYVRDYAGGGSPIDKVVGFILEARQPLLRGGRVYVARRNITDSELDVDIQRAILATEVLRVTAETKAAYYDAILTTRLVEVVQDAIRRDQDLLAASNALFEAGRVNKRDVFSAEISLASDQAKLASRNASRELSQNRLRDTLGLPIDMQVDIEQLEVPFRPVEIQLDDWIQSAFANRPELVRIRKTLDKADLEVRVRENDVLPQLDLFGLGRRAANTESYNWEAGAAFAIPFGNVSARSALARARVQKARIERNYVQQERSIELEVRALEISLRETIDRLKALTNGVVNARGKREIAAVRFQLGLANNLDITDADEDLTSAESDLLSTVVQYATSLAFLEAAIARPI
jgi:OMF family outer membrane factor